MNTHLQNRPFRFLLVGLGVFLLLLPFLSLTQPAHAGGTFTVTRFDDPAPGACAPNDCSLREAIQAANLALGGTIELPAGTYVLSLMGKNEDMNATGDLDIHASITIQGDPDSNTIIQGGAGWDDRILHVFSSLTVQVNDVILEGGNTDFWGGGIYNVGGLLTLSNCVVRNNLAVAGGGIMNDGGGTLTISLCSIEQNEASNNGGGIYVGNNTFATISDSDIVANINSGIVNWGELVVFASLFKLNEGGWGGGLSNNTIANLSNIIFQENHATITGGGLANTSPTAEITINYSVFITNTAVSSGGAITNAGIMTLLNSTASGNGADGSSGGVGNSGHLTMNAVTLDNNHADGIYNVGGGLNNSGVMTVTNTTVTNNDAPNGYGGGLVNTDTGQATFEKTTFSDNQAFIGGGLFNYGTMTVTESTIAMNTAFNATDSGGGVFNAHILTLVQTSVLTNTANGRGGGIYNGLTFLSSTLGNLTLIQSTVAGNEAVNGFGGGLAVVTGTVTLENSTFSGNTTTRSGGGIYNDTGAVSLNNVTLAENTADSSQLSLGKGGGFFTQNGSFTLVNSLIALNTDGSTEAPDCWGAPTSLGYNLLQDLTGCTFVTGTGDLTGQAPLLGSLADNGGPTLTYALLPGSPAMDTANPADPGTTPEACTTVDQRGISRPADGDNDEVARCDIGAFEAYDAPPVYYVYLPTIVR